MFSGQNSTKILLSFAIVKDKTAIVFQFPQQSLSVQLLKLSINWLLVVLFHELLKPFNCFSNQIQGHVNNIDKEIACVSVKNVKLK